MLDECDHLGHKFVAISDSSSPGDKAITFNKLLRDTTSVAHRPARRVRRHHLANHNPACTIGLAGNRSKLWASLERLTDFDVINFAATDIAMIRLLLPTLTARQLALLPDNLAANYRSLGLV